MVDTVPTEVRSRIMSAVKNKDTRSEIALRRALYARGFRYQIHQRTLPGKPDIALAKWNAVLFVNGCFWHRHAGCRKATMPMSNQQFWETKFNRNVARDRANYECLVSKGWRVGVIWECWIENALDDTSVDQIIGFLKSEHCSFAEWSP